MLSELAGGGKGNSVVQRAMVQQERTITLGKKLWKERYARRYPSLGKQLASSDMREAYVAATTAILMRNQEDYLRGMAKLHGESVITANLGPMAPRVIDVVRIFYPNLIANFIAEIQPLETQTGQIITVKPRFSNTAGGVNAGDEVFLRPTDGNYASDQQNEFVASGDGATTAFADVASLGPIRPGTFTVLVAGSTVAKDDGNGAIVGDGVTGTINYSTKAFSISFTVAPTSGQAVNVEYRYDLEQNPNSIRKLEIGLNLVPVQAKPHPLQIEWSVQAQLAAQAQYQFDVQETTSQLAAFFIKQERDRKLTRLISRAASAVTLLNFDAAVPGPGNFTKRAHYQDFGNKLVAAEAEIFQRNGRGNVSFVLAGSNAVQLIQAQADFVEEVNAVPIGAHKVGTWRGRVDVIKDQTLDPNEYIFGFRGMVVGDAALILAEWIPLFLTPVWQAPNLINQQGMLSMYDTLLNNAKYYVKGTLSNFAA